MKKYLIRPEEELYDIIEDKWCQNNLAEKPELKNIKAKLRKELLKWMKECEDEGLKTEMEAFDHMPGKNNR